MINSYGLRLFAMLALVYLTSALLCAALLESSKVLGRLELETIDRRFEDRGWLGWTAEGLRRANPAVLWDYHEKHEIPRRWWAWDYTLSWLVSENHRAPAESFVIFNRMPEDEPPDEAVRSHPWLQPLTHDPLPRKTLAEFVQRLVLNKARLIIIDLDLSGNTDEDAILAKTIHDAVTGKLSGHPVPVLLAKQVVARSDGPYVVLNSRPSGVTRQIENLGIAEQTIGQVCRILDADHVERRHQCAIASPIKDVEPSLAVKAVQQLTGSVPAELPEQIYGDYIVPPGSELYPVRPWLYLLDPEKKNNLSNAGSADVNVPGSVVIIGDGVNDLQPAPLACGQLMSNAEILAQTIDTLLNRTWFVCLEGWASAGYIGSAFILASALFLSWKEAVRSMGRRFNMPFNERSALTLWLFLCDVPVYAANILLFCLLNWVMFAHFGLILPVLAPACSLAIAAIVTAVVERECLRTISMKQQLKAEQERYQLIAQKHEAELHEQSAVARAQTLQREEDQRREFAHRINHDLKAPVTILNWTLAKLKRDLNSAGVGSPKLDILSDTADRLFQLVNELLRSYGCAENTRQHLAPANGEESCDLNELARKCVNMATSLAEINGSSVQLEESSQPALVCGNAVRICRALDNLVGNALRHNPPGTRVVVSITFGERFQTVSVADTGSGNAQQLRTLMESPSERKGNRGMGLSIARSLVQELDGKITVAANPQGGVRFILAFPTVANNPTDRVDSR